MSTFVEKIVSTTLDLLFPIRCAGCHRESKILCQECIPGLARLEAPYCTICASPGPLSPCRQCRESPLDIDGIRAPFLMEGAVKDAIHSFKYRSIRAAAPDLARLLAQHLARHNLPGEVLVPVPLHPRRLRSRGYNQSALLAKELAKHTGISLESNLLTRAKDAPPQVEASSPAQRRSNVEGSFHCARDVTGQKVLLIDDVATTGNTLSACAAALKAGGAASVWGLVLAREK